MRAGPAAFLSKQNLLHNLRVIKQQAPEKKIMAMVKANAYGHGGLNVARLLDGLVDFFGVARFYEAKQLINGGIKTPVVLAEGAFDIKEMASAIEMGLHIVIHQNEHLTWLNQLPSRSPLNLWLKIDTGMGRLGFLPSELTQVYEQISRHQVILMSHLSCADEPEHPLTHQQIEIFSFCKNLLNLPSTLCNSAGMFYYPQAQHEIVRPGLALYGAHPVSGLTGDDFGLKPVMTLASKIIAVREIPAGASIGYGARFVAPHPMVLGIVAAGYGDGYPLSAKDGTPVLVHEQKCPIVGRVSMDMLAIDVSKVSGVHRGDRAVLWGEGLPIEEIAQAACSIPWVLMTSLQSRVEHIWETQDELSIL